MQYSLVILQREAERRAKIDGCEPLSVQVELPHETHAQQKLLVACEFVKDVHAVNDLLAFEDVASQNSFPSCFHPTQLSAQSRHARSSLSGPYRQPKVT